jgi:hypothetical protein
MTKLKTAALGILCLLVSLTAPFAVPIALLFTARDAKNLAWAWYDTPDEPDLIGLYEPSVALIYARYGWFIACWYWFGWRNRAHGFDSLWSCEADRYWPPGDGSWVNSDKFLVMRHFGPLLLEFGWPVYASKKYPSGLEFRPMLTVKNRPIKKG